MANIDNAWKAGQKLLRCEDKGYSGYTPTMSNNFKDAEAWYLTPKVGDCVYFYSPTIKRISHVGLVTKVNPFKRTFDAIEGNTSDKAFDRNGGMCMEKFGYSYALVGGVNRIAGFGRPAYSSKLATANEVITEAKKWAGYEEKASNSQLNDFHANVGKNNYTIFSQTFGVNGVAWCQYYICYVFYMACKSHLTKKSTGWVQDAKGFWYYRINGANVKNAWQEVGGFMYYFTSTGAMKTGWVGSDETGWYYCDPDKGYMKTSQWVQGKNNKWYYVSQTGLMVTSAYVKHKNGYCWLDDKGVWDGKYLPTVPAGAEIAL